MKNNKTLKLTLFLLLVCGVSAFLIAYVNQVTVDVIAQQKLEATKAGYAEVYPGASDYIEAAYEDTDPLISAVVLAKNGGEDAGVIYTVVPSGYNGPIEALVGFDIRSKEITGVKVLSQTETAGLGANVQEPWFTARFAGKNAEQAIAVVKIEQTNENEVQAITAATITSEAIVSGINAARADFIARYGSN